MSSLVGANLSAAERRAVERFVAELRDELGDNLLAVWLYGSRARGEGGGLDSDVDLLVITRDRTEDAFLVDRLAVDAELSESDEAVDLAAQIWTQDHLHSRRAIRSFFVQEVDRDKLVVYGAADL